VLPSAGSHGGGHRGMGRCNFFGKHTTRCRPGASINSRRKFNAGDGSRHRVERLRDGGSNVVVATFEAPREN